MGKAEGGAGCARYNVSGFRQSRKNPGAGNRARPDARGGESTSAHLEVEKSTALGPRTREQPRAGGRDHVGRERGRPSRGSEGAGRGNGDDADWPLEGLKLDPSKWASRGREQRSERGSRVRGRAPSAD